MVVGEEERCHVCSLFSPHQTTWLHSRGRSPRYYTGSQALPGSAYKSAFSILNQAKTLLLLLLHTHLPGWAARKASKINLVLNTPSSSLGLSEARNTREQFQSRSQVALSGCPYQQPALQGTPGTMWRHCPPGVLRACN